MIKFKLLIFFCIFNTFFSIGNTRIVIDDGESMISRLFSTSTWNKDIDAQFLELYVKKIYQGIGKYTLDVLYFIEKLPMKEQKILALRYLFDEIEKSKDIYRAEFMKFAYVLNQFQGKNAEDENILYIKNKVPQHILNFPWHQSVKIKNKHYGQYFSGLNLSGERYNLDNKRRLATIASKTSSIEFNWKLLFNKNESNFKFFNENLETFLCCDNSKFDQYRRHVLLWNGETPTECYNIWEIEPLEGAKTFRIKNLFWNEYLYSFDQENIKWHERKLTLLWRVYGCDGTQCEWEFESVDQF